MRLLILLLVLVTMSMSSAAERAAATIEIRLAGSTEAENLKRQQIERVLETYDLDKWWFTESILVDESARGPHSHPLLTLGTRRPNADLSLLSQLLHEQIHWFEDPRQKQVQAVVERLKKRYPQVPQKRPEGAGSEFSTYLHLTALLGEETARSVISNNSKYFYMWIYRTVLRDSVEIRSILKTEGLYIN